MTGSIKVKHILHITHNLSSMIHGQNKILIYLIFLNVKLVPNFGKIQQYFVTFNAVTIPTNN